MLNIRGKVFETNSSSVHTLAIAKENEYEQWVNGELLYLDVDSVYFPNEVPSKQFFTLEEAKEFFNYLRTFNEYLDDNDFDTTFVTFNHYIYSDYWLENYSERHETESGDRIVVFGKYGRDG